MELLQLRYFQTVARLESITRAANYHHVPQPAMSQTIARLENDLGGIKLFNRHNNRIFLNENGKRFLASVDRILAELDDSVKALGAHHDHISGNVNLLVTENRRFVFTCVSNFSKKYPDISFSISHEYTADPTITYDLCIRSSPAYRQMTAFAPLIREQIFLNVNEDHPIASAESIMLGELRDEKFITMSSQSTLYNITFESCRACGFEPKVPFICDDPYFVRKYVAENMGIAFAPSISWAGRIRSNTKLIPVVNPTIESTSYLIWDEHRYLTPVVRNFRDYLLECAHALENNMLF